MQQKHRLYMQVHVAPHHASVALGRASPSLTLKVCIRAVPMGVVLQPLFGLPQQNQTWHGLDCKSRLGGGAGITLEQKPCVHPQDPRWKQSAAYFTVFLFAIAVSVFQHEICTTRHSLVLQ